MSTPEEDLYRTVWDAFDALDDPAETRDTPAIITDALIAAGYRKAKPEWGVRYDTHVDWVDVAMAGESFAKVTYGDSKDEGAIAVVRRYVTGWEIADES